MNKRKQAENSCVVLNGYRQFESHIVTIGDI